MLQLVDVLAATVQLEPMESLTVEPTAKDPHRVIRIGKVTTIGSGGKIIVGAALLSDNVAVRNSTKQV
jgi:hypothetical protein